MIDAPCTRCYNKYILGKRTSHCYDCGAGFDVTVKLCDKQNTHQRDTPTNWVHLCLLLEMSKLPFETVLRTSPSAYARQVEWDAYDAVKLFARCGDFTQSSVLSVRPGTFKIQHIQNQLFDGVFSHISMPSESHHGIIHDRLAEMALRLERIARLSA